VFPGFVTLTPIDSRGYRGVGGVLAASWPALRSTRPLVSFLRTCRLLGDTFGEAHGLAGAMW